jgi:tRNA modification GTPase
VLAIHGPEAWNIVRPLFRVRFGKQPELPLHVAPGQFWLGRFGDELADECVLTVKQNSPTPWLELHLHGGREVVRWVEETLEARGIRSCDWRRFIERTAGDHFQAMALAALAEAPTMRTASILLDQANGAFGRAITTAREALLQEDWPSATSHLEALTQYTSLGRHLTTPWQVVIAGAPNVGKSSLVNALAGYQRSVVAETPGTTRDVVRTRLAIDGWPVEVADTAGLRETGEKLEGAGVELAREAVVDADLCLWVLDAASTPVWPVLEQANLRFVINKTDLAPAWDFNRATQAIGVSALTGAGIGELCEAISRWLVSDPPAPGAAVPFTAALCASLNAAKRALQTDAEDVALRQLLSIWNDGLTP